MKGVEKKAAMTYYRLLTGPLEGVIVDDGGLWREFHGVESFDDADEDMQCRFRQSGYADWDEWLNSWDSEELSDADQAAIQN